MRQELRADDSTVGVVELGVPDGFLPQGTRDEILESRGAHHRCDDRADPREAPPGT